MFYLVEHDDCLINIPHKHPGSDHELAYGDEHDEVCLVCGTENTVLDEWSVTLVIRTSANGTRPSKWDFNTLLDLQSGIGEQAWLESETLNRTGTEKELNDLGNI
jgi:hypothetical protein